MPQVKAYLDTNAVRDLHGPRACVSAPLVERVRAAIERGNLAVPFSPVVAQEILAIAGVEPLEANSVGAFYLRLARLEFTLEAPGVLLGLEIAAYAGDVVPPPYLLLSDKDADGAEALLLGQARSGVAERVVARAKAEADAWCQVAKKSRDEVRAALIRAGVDMVPGTPLRSAIASTWGGCALEFARRIAWGLQHVPLERREAATRGDDLLAIPGFRAAAGVSLGQAVTQVLNNQNPRAGDYSDSQHCTIAACARLPLVTADVKLSRLVAAIPEPSPLRVMDLRQLVAELPAA